MMHRFIAFLGLMIVLGGVGLVSAAEPGQPSAKPGDAKELSGMSIVGNDEAPKSLYIVPWKSSEIGVKTSLDMMLDKQAVPVDREIFKRQLDFYQVRTTNRSGG